MQGELPGALNNSRGLPDKLTPRSERLNPVAVAVNQTSFPDGDQANPKALAHRSVRSAFLPFRSMTLRFHRHRPEADDR